MRNKPYPDEFRRKMVELYKSGRSASQLAQEFEPCAQTIRNCVEQADIDAGECDDDGLTTDEREELERLRAENRQLEEECEILEKAAAWSRQQTNPTSNDESSNS